MRTSLGLATIAAVIAAAACGGDGAGGEGGTGESNDTSRPPAPKAGTSSSGGAKGGRGDPSGGAELPCDVDAILGKNCRMCHGAQTSYGAPFSLVSYADLVAPWKGGKVYEHVKARVHSDGSPMPPSPNPRLDAAALATIDGWVDGGAKPATDSCEAEDGGTPQGPPPLPCTADQQLRPATAGAIDQATIDQYECYGIDVTVTQDRHVIAIAPHVDNKAIVHHLLLFQTDSSVSPDPTPCAAGGAVGWRLFSGWAPGGGNVIMPAPAGVRESGTTHWVVQVHYNNSKALANQTDKSGFDMCSTDQLRPNDAEMMAFGSIDFMIPPRATKDVTCEYTFPSYEAERHVFSMWPHMHNLGKSMSSVISRGTDQITLVESKAYDFNAQSAYPTDAVIQPGDKITTHCLFNNTTDQTVFFGEKTGDEMCFDFAFYYPKITTPLWSWSMPSLAAICN